MLNKILVVCTLKTELKYPSSVFFMQFLQNKVWVTDELSGAPFVFLLSIIDTGAYWHQ